MTLKNFADFGAPVVSADWLNHVDRVTLDVTSFGAVGDGTTDDATALAAAFNSGNATVELPGGRTYMIGSQVAVPQSGITIRSVGGAIIKPIGGLASGFGLLNVTASRVTFDGIVFDGNTDAPPISGDYSGVSLNTNGGTITDITFRNCKFQNFNSYGVYAFAAGTLTRVRFENCVFTRFTNTSATPPAAVQLVQPLCSELTVNGCTFNDLTGAGFAARSVAGASPCAHVSVTGCLFNHDSFLYTSIGVEVWEAEGLAVSGNTFANARMGLSIYGSSMAISGNTFINHTSYSIEGGVADGMTISGNTFTDFQYGIILYNGTDDVTISGNTFRDALTGATTALNLGWALQTSGSGLSENYNRLVVINNTIINCSGIRVERLQDGVISGNVLETTAAENLCLIRAGSNLNDSVTITGNVMRTAIDASTVDTGWIIYAGERVSVSRNTLVSTTASANVGSAICNASGAVLTEVVIEHNLIKNFACGIRTTTGSPTIASVLVSDNSYFDCTASHTLETGVAVYDRAAGSTADVGDADVTLRSNTASVIRFTVALTADRAITLDTTTAYRGQRFRIVRLGAGAFNLTVTGLKTLLQNEWVDVVYTGSAWAVCGAGSLVPRILSGSGTPEAVVTAPVGTLFTRTDGGANTTLYVKESGSSNTGWVAK